MCTLSQILHTPNLCCFGNIPREEDSQPPTHGSIIPNGMLVCILYIQYSQEHRGNPGNHQAICRGQVF